MLADRRRTFQIGGSRGITLPGTLPIGPEVSMAAGRLLLIDTTGQIPENKLWEFLTEQLEPLFLRWWEEQKHRDLVAQTTPAKGSVAALEVKVQGPPVYDVRCPCGYVFPWDLNQGTDGFCPLCGLHLSFKL